MDITNARMRIDIQKTGKTAGNVTFEGLKQHDGCFSRMQTVAVGTGRILSQEEINHGEDDAPVYDTGFVSSN
jgi:hypothetical protein